MNMTDFKNYLTEIYGNSVEAGNADHKNQRAHASFVPEKFINSFGEGTIRRYAEGAAAYKILTTIRDVYEGHDDTDGIEFYLNRTIKMMAGDPASTDPIHVIYDRAELRALVKFLGRIERVNKEKSNGNKDNIATG